MVDSENATKVRCPGCGREYEDNPPSYCVDCGTRLETRRKRGTAVAVTAAVLVALLVLGAGALALVYLVKPGKSAPALPSTAAQLRASVDECEEYLNDKGAALASGRAKDAPVYSVEARLDTKESSISGKEKVLFTNRTPDTLREIVFRVYANSADESLSGDGAQITGARAGGESARAGLDGTLLTVSLPEPLAPGDDTLVSFSFEEFIPEVQGLAGDLEGLLTGEQAGGYGIFGHDDDTYDLGYFIPLVASYRNGAWESREVPSFGDVADFDCAYFNVSLDVPGDYTVAATGVQTGESGSGGRRRLTFAAGPARDFAAQASSAYQSSAKKVGGTQVTSYYHGEAAESGGRALDIAASALDQYNRHFGPYPYTRLNVCEAPLAGGAAGMEFTGQVLISKMLYGLSSGEVPLPDALKDLGGDQFNELLKNITGGIMGDTLEFVVAHEVCHQWWGIVVGSDSIAHPWQDESLTNYCSVLYVRWENGRDAAERQLETQLNLPYQAAGLLGGGDGVVDSPVDAFRNQEHYTAVVYSKGALFFQALEKEMGAAAFVKSLRSYYGEYAFLEPSPDDLMQAFKNNSADPPAVAALHQRWIKEEHGDEDIASTLPGGSLLEDLMKDLAPDGSDLGPLEDMFKEFWDQLVPEGDQSGETPFPSTSPDIAI